MSSDNPYQSPESAKSLLRAPQVDIKGKVSRTGNRVHWLLVSSMRSARSLWTRNFFGLANDGRSVIDIAGSTGKSNGPSVAGQRNAPGMGSIGSSMVQSLASMGPPGPSAACNEWDSLLICAIIVIVLGALKMMKLKSYGMAMTSSILAMIPCLSSCCCVIGSTYRNLVADCSQQFGCKERLQFQRGRHVLGDLNGNRKRGIDELARIVRR